MPHPARTTTLSWNIPGLQAIPIRGAKPHCRPVSVESLTPLVGNSGLFPATMKPFDYIEWLHRCGEQSAVSDQGSQRFYADGPAVGLGTSYWYGLESRDVPRQGGGARGMGHVLRPWRAVYIFVAGLCFGRDCWRSIRGEPDTSVGKFPSLQPLCLLGVQQLRESLGADAECGSQR